MEVLLSQLYNENPIRDVRLDDTSLPRETLYCRSIESDVKNALKSENRKDSRT